MSIKIRVGDISYKDENGHFVGINGISDHTTDGIISDAQAALAEIETRKDTIMSSIASAAGRGTDSTFTQTGVAADAKAVGDLRDVLKNELLELLQHVVYTDSSGSLRYNALRDALGGQPKVLSSISATFDPGSTPIYDTDTLNTLKQYLTVVATYTDTTTDLILSSACTLTGTLAVGTNTITVGYGGKTTTFEVTVVAAPAALSSIDAVYSQSRTVYTSDTLDSLKTDLVVTAHYSDSTSSTVTTYTLSGTLTQGTSTITVSYGGKTTTFNVTEIEVLSVASISAVLNLNGALVREGDNINTLKQYLVVTATSGEGTTTPVAAGDYTLSGELTVSSNEYDASQQTITVTYVGKTTTFTVTVYNAMTANRVTLPAGYTQLVMIRNPGNANSARAYIDTGFTQSTIDHAEYGVQVSYESYGTGTIVYHILSSKKTWYPYFIKSGESNRTFLAKNQSTSSNAIAINESWNYHTNYVIEGFPDVKINGTTVATVESAGAADNDYNLFIFAYNTGSTYSGTAGIRMYYLKMFDAQNQLLHHYIPCKNSSNVAGLYDIISNTFNASANGNSFVAGAVL